jgi:hypothetical protein
MGSPQRPAEAIQDQLLELNTIALLILFGVVMVFLGWLRYKNRNSSGKTKPRKREKPQTKQK